MQQHKDELWECMMQGDNYSNIKLIVKSFQETEFLVMSQTKYLCVILVCDVVFSVVFGVVKLLKLILQSVHNRDTNCN